MRVVGILHRIKTYKLTKTKNKLYMKILKIILAFTIIYILAVLFLRWSDHQTAQVEAASDKYEACVKKEYGMSPAAYYNDQGQYPECITK